MLVISDVVFEVQGLEEDAICEIGAEIRAAGGVMAAAERAAPTPLCHLTLTHRISLPKARKQSLCSGW